MKNNPKLAQELAKKYRTQEGLMIQYASPAAVENAVKGLRNADVTVDFGGNKTMKLEKTSGGSVTVGSGADGLIADSSGSVGSPLVVRAPLQPKMSITIVTDDRSLETCAQKIEKNADGSFVKWQKTGYRICTRAGAPMRVPSAGTYQISMKSSIKYSSLIDVDLEENENKMVVAREIIVPYEESNSTVQVTLVRDYESSEIEVNKDVRFWFRSENVKSSLLGWSEGATSNFFKDVQTLEEFSTRFKSIPRDNGQQIGLLGANGEIRAPWLVQDYDRFSEGVFFTMDETKKQDVKFAVLPGVYTLVWKIDGAFDETKGLYVQ